MFEPMVDVQFLKGFFSGFGVVSEQDDPCIGVVFEMKVLEVGTDEYGCLKDELLADKKFKEIRGKEFWRGILGFFHRTLTLTPKRFEKYWTNTDLIEEPVAKLIFEMGRDFCDHLANWMGQEGPAHDFGYWMDPNFSPEGWKFYRNERFLAGGGLNCLLFDEIFKHEFPGEVIAIGPKKMYVLFFMFGD